LGWIGGEKQVLERVLIPSTLLSFLASELYTLVTDTFSPQMGRWVLRQVTRPRGDWVAWEANWMSHSVPKALDALVCWADYKGRLQPELMWGGEWLRVPMLLAHGLLMGVPVDFACNNAECNCLDGPWELGLVSHRAEVVCGGCGVARYCSRECQEQHWDWHERTCERLQGKGWAPIASAACAK
jgi:hypothetical protein